MSDGEVDKEGRIVLVRHGETAWSRVGKHTSVTDIPLTDVGEDQARAQAAVLAGHEFALVLSSPRRRSRRTSELLGYPNQRIDDDLVEWDYGGYEGMTTEEIIESRGGEPWSLWTDGVPEGQTPGENADQVHERVSRVIARCEPVLQEGGDVLIVAHGHVLRGLAVTWTGLPVSGGVALRLETGSVSELGYEHETRAILRWNCPADVGADFRAKTSA